MIADLLEKAVGMSNEDILAEFKKHALGDLCSEYNELLHRRQEVRTIFGHLNSSFIDAESPGNREFETLVRLTDLVKVMIGRKQFELHTAESTVVAPSDSTPTSPATARTPQRGTAPGGDQVHQRLVAAVQWNFGCVGKPSFEAFYSAIEPKTITNSEFCAWKRGDGRHCGRAKWVSLDAAADKLPKPNQLTTKL